MERELDVHCPLCADPIKAVTLEDLERGIHLNCLRCGFSCYIEDGKVEEL